VVDARPAAVIIAERLNRLASGAAIQIAAELSNEGVEVKPDNDIIDVEEEKVETDSNGA
jgi:NADH dehydrogenase FAD-containing subunit